MFSRNDFPESLFAIQSLDLTSDLLEDPLDAGWFCLGSSSLSSAKDDTHVVTRRSFLIRPKLLRRAFAVLNSFGDVINELGQLATITIHHRSGGRSYRYQPAHAFQLNNSGIWVEPLVSERVSERKNTLLINPDTWLYLGLEELNSGSGVWIESRSGMEVLRERSSAEGIRYVEIQRDHLLRYLRDRRRALVVGSYTDARLDRPTQADRAQFAADRVEVSLTLNQFRTAGYCEISAQSRKSAGVVVGMDYARSMSFGSTSRHSSSRSIGSSKGSGRCINSDERIAG